MRLFELHYQKRIGEYENEQLHDRVALINPRTIMMVLRDYKEDVEIRFLDGSTLLCQGPDRDKVWEQLRLSEEF